MPNTMPAAGEAMPIDEIVSIARALGEAERQREDFEMRTRTTDMGRRHVFETAEENCSDKTYAMRELLSYHKATSLTGAAVQVAEIIARVDVLCDHFPESSWDYRAKLDRRIFLRLAFSVLDLLNTLAEEKVDDVIYQGFSNQHVNPWKTPEELIALRGLGDEVRA